MEVYPRFPQKEELVASTIIGSKLKEGGLIVSLFQIETLTFVEWKRMNLHKFVGVYPPLVNFMIYFFKMAFSYYPNISQSFHFFGYIFISLDYQDVKFNELNITLKKDECDDGHIPNLHV